jgi:hypothetical protein
MNQLNLSQIQNNPMKKIAQKISLLLVAAALTATEASAQLQLPAPSPKATVMQTVGLTDITIDYSSPAVKGRAIWGQLLPYDSLWRAGANAATKITFSKDVTVEGTAVPKGTYSIFVIPSKAADWTIILNKNANASTDEYKKAEDIVRVKAKAQAVPHRERLAYSFSNFTEDAATVDLEWEKMRVSFNVKLDTEKQAMNNINNTVNGIWRQYASAASYALNMKKDYDLGLTWINKSIELKNDWYNNWLKAQLLAAKNMNKEAYAQAMKAKELGDKADNFFFKNEVEKALVDWKGKQ